MLDLNSLFSYSPDIGFITDRSGTIQAVTAGSERVLGIPRGELVGMGLGRLDDSGRVEKFFTDSGKGESRMRLRFSLRTRAGRVLSIDSMASSLRSPEGQPIGWFFAGQDLRGAVAEARGTRTILDTLIDSIGAGLWSFDPNGTVITWSRGCEATFGIPRDQAEGKLSAAALFAQPGEFRKAVAEVDRSGQYFGEVDLLSSSGSKQPFHVSMTRLSGGDSETLGYSCVSLDIAERKRVEEFQRVLFERAGEAILVVDPPSRRILDVNQKACEIHGYSREEMIGLRVEDILPPSIPPSVIEAIDRALAETGRFESERHTHIRKGGSVFPCAINIRRIAVGGRLYTITICRDLTEQAKAEEFFRVLFEKANDGLILVREKGLGVVEANDEACRLLGYAREELLRLTLPDLVAPEHRDRLEGLPERGSREAFGRDRRLLLRKDGSRLPTDHTLSLLEFAGSSYLLAAVRDITEAVKGEEALRESAERFRGLFDATFEGIAVHEDGLLVDVNEAYASMLGYTREELIGKRVVDHLAPESLEDMQRQMKSRSEKPLEVTAIRRDGTRIRVEGRARSIVYRGRTMRLGAVRDVTEARRVSGQLEEAKAFLEHIQESANDGLVLLDDQGVYVAANRKFLELRGLRREELLGRSFLEVTAPERRAGYREYFERLMKGESVRMRTQMIRTDGREITVDVGSVPLERGGRKYAFAIVRDVTDQVRAEEELKKAHEQLEKRVQERTAELSAEVAQRRRAEEALRQAHDELERRVAERTGELAQANRLLHSEIEERKRAVESLKLYEEIFARASEGVLILDAQGRMLQQNEAHRKLLGYSDEEIVGKTPELWATSYPSNRQEMEDKGTFQGEVTSRTKWGQKIIVELSAFPTRDAAGKTTGVVAIKRDVTERKWAERAFRFIFEGTSSHTGEHFYRSLVRHLASALQVRFALLSEACDQPPTRVRTVAFWAGDDFGKDFEKDLAGSPCLEVLQGKDCCHPRDLLERFPSDAVLAELGAQSYMGVPLVDAEGRFVGHLAVLHDRPIEDTEGKMSILKIFASRAGGERERLKVEVALRKSEERWRSLATNVPDFVLTINRRLEIEFINRTVAGGQIEDVLGQSVLIFVPKEYQERVQKAIEQVFETGKPTAYEVPSVADHGGVAWYSSRVGPIFHEGKVVAVSLIATDITDRRRVDEALRFQKTLLESQSEAAIDGILVVSREGKMVSLNRRFIEMWDIPDPIVQSRSDSEALKSVLAKVEDSEEFLERVHYLYEHPDEESRDEISLLDGRTFDRYSAPVRSREGVLYGRVWYFRDVTGRKRTEVELRRAAEETRRAYEDLKQAQAQLIRTEKLASIGMLVSGVAHEINNPLNVMYGNLQLLGQAIEGPPPSGKSPAGERRGQARARRVRRMIRDALKAAEHARGIVEDFRSFARDVRTAESVDLNDCLEETVSLMQRELHPRVRIVKQLRPLPSVRCFRGQMNQVFLNLLKNASEAIERKGTITLRTRRKEGRVVVEVADTGRGMVEDVRRKLFEPFFTTKPVGKGLGLGLSISAMIVHNHGGRISVRSRPGRGSVFRVELPVRS